MRRICRRQVVQGAGLIFTGVGVAGCVSDTHEESPTDDTTDTPQETETPEEETRDEEQNSDEEKEPESEEEEDDSFNFQYQDILNKEYERMERLSESVAGSTGKTPEEVMDTKHLDDADFTDYGEMIHAVGTTTNEIVEALGGSSANNASAQEVLNRYFVNNNIEARMLTGQGPGHGFSYITTPNHELSVIDSNAYAHGPVKDRPLQTGRSDSSDANDRLARLIGKNFEDLDHWEDRGRYTDFPANMLTFSGEDVETAVSTDVADSYYEEAIFAENGETIFDKFRPTIGTIKFAYNEELDIKNVYGITIDSTVSELPDFKDEYRENQELFQEYAEELIENHVSEYETEEQYRDHLEWFD